MSGESAHHVALVAHLINVIRDRHSAVAGMFMLADHHSFGRDRPSQIGGYTPDVFASNIPDTFRVLGEAKTPDDLESQRSARQLTAFLDHLCLREGSTLYVAVPLFYVPRARMLIRSLRGEHHTAVNVQYITANF